MIRRPPRSTRTYTLFPYTTVGSRSPTARCAKRTGEPACEFNRGRQAAAAAGSRDDDPTSPSPGTGGFGAYALSGESVVVVVGNSGFAAGFTRQAPPSAFARRFRDNRRRQCTPNSNE